jgi:hypothetical protein
MSERSTSAGSAEMTTIGGNRSRQESKLLELRRDPSSDKEKQAPRILDDSIEALISDEDLNRE